MGTTIDPGESKKFGDCVVTALDANHCPGALMFVIQLTSGQTILHTGDFRAISHMETKQEVGQFSTIDQVYLDTTYCKPEYDFPPQAEVIEFPCPCCSHHRVHTGIHWGCC